MTRIIAGQAKGCRLQVPRSGVRPTSDRIREAIFNSLGSMIEDWSAERVLDLYAGTGALGLEALSRGANGAEFVERDAAVAAVLRSNIAAVGLGGDVRVADAAKPPGRGESDSAPTLVFLDPPYSIASEQVGQCLADWHRAGAFDPTAIVILEGPARWADWVWPTGLREIRSKRYGDTRIWYGSPEDHLAVRR